MKFYAETEVRLQRILIDRRLKNNYNMEKLSLNGTTLDQLSQVLLRNMLIGRPIYAWRMTNNMEHIKIYQLKDERIKETQVPIAGSQVLGRQHWTISQD